MNLKAFLDERGPRWDELDGALVRSRGRPERLGASGVLRLGELYREASTDLAFARRRFAGDPIVVRLERLVTGARALVYASGRSEGSLLRFAASGYWRRVREQPLALAWAMLVAPVLLCALWALRDPGAAVGLVPDALQRAGDAHGASLHGAGDQAAFASSIFTNNVQVSLLAFAGGIGAGIATSLLLIYNGALLGAVAGLAFGASNGSSFIELVAPHGVLELSCIAVTGAAGLRLGWAVVSPGPRRRGPVVLEVARDAVEVVLGTVPWLIVAGLVEGFVTPRHIGPAAALAVGCVLGGAYWGLVVWRGRR